MPTVHKLGALRIVIYPNDHRPAHVHVGGGKGSPEAVFELHCPGGPPELRSNYGFSQRRLTRIAKYIHRHLSSLCRSWREIHGDF